MPGPGRALALAAAHGHESSQILESSMNGGDRKDMIKIFGVKLDNNKLQAQARRDHGNHDSSLIREERREERKDRLPALKGGGSSVPRGLQARVNPRGG